MSYLFPVLVGGGGVEQANTPKLASFSPHPGRMLKRQTLDYKLSCCLLSQKTPMDDGSNHMIFPHKQLRLSPDLRKGFVCGQYGNFNRACLFSCGEGNGNLLQYSCLENPTDGGAWQATVHGITKSQTQLHFLSP